MMRGPSESKRPELIQVISTADAQPQRPQHRLRLKTDAAGGARRVELTVELPKVSSVSECQLRICKVRASTLPWTLLMREFTNQSQKSYKKMMGALCLSFLSVG